jgi:hypothetical protein
MADVIGFAFGLSLLRAGVRGEQPTAFGALSMADWKRIVLSEDGILSLAAVSPERYVELAQLDTGLGKLCWTPPVIANGLIYCHSSKEKQGAINVRK